MTETNDAEIGKLIRERKALQDKVSARTRELNDLGGHFSVVGTALQQYPHSLSFERRSIEVQFSRRGFQPVEPSQIPPMATVVDEVEALRADMSALKTLQEKLGRMGYS